MRKIISKLLMLCLLAASANAQSVFNAKEVFNPQFYPYPGNEYRSSSGEPGPKYWQNHADYKINVQLDTVSHTVEGNVEITYTNNSVDNLKFLWLQLDQNIYKSDSRGSATTTQQKGRWANGAFTDGYEINNVFVHEATAKKPARYTINDTRMQIWLNSPLKAQGGKITFSMPFKFTVPEYGTDRMGRELHKNGWIYEIAQWFPRMCVYDDIQGWNVLPYVGAGEFYLEYGDIEFNITAPSGIIVVGGGELLNPQECFTPAQLAKYNAAKNSDKTIVIQSADDINSRKFNTAKKEFTWKFKITNTRDAAWAASRAFILDGARINIPDGKKALALSAYPEESAKQANGNDWRRSTEYVKASIEYYSNRFYPYPYSAAVNVAGIVGGMEYPGIVFCSSQSKGGSLWGVTDHEFGHIWFPMIVGSNERKYAWMDEGFNTFINDFSTRDFNNGEYKSFSYFAAPTSNLTIKRVFGPTADGLFNIPEVIQQSNLGNAAYFKPSLMLHTLRDVVLGADRFDVAFKEYIQRWAFKHPTPWDFFRTMENVAGEDLSWFWRSWVINEWKFDAAVTDVTYEKGDATNGSIVSLENLEKMPMPITVLIKEENGKEHKINLPVEIWQRGSKYKFSAPTTSMVKEVVLDPDKKLFDFNRENNSWKKAF